MQSSTFGLGLTQFLHEKKEAFFLKKKKKERGDLHPRFYAKGRKPSAQL